MSQHADSSALAPAEARVYQEINYLNADRGVMSWLKTLDHKRIGVMYFASRAGDVPAGRHLRDDRSARADHARARPSSAPTPTTACSPCTGWSWCSCS